MNLIKILIYLLLFLELYGFGFFNEYKNILNLNDDFLPIKEFFIEGFITPFKNLEIKKLTSLHSPYYVIYLLVQFYRILEIYDN